MLLLGHKDNHRIKSLRVIIRKPAHKMKRDRQCHPSSSVRLTAAFIHLYIKQILSERHLCGPCQEATKRTYILKMDGFISLIFLLHLRIAVRQCVCVCVRPIFWDAISMPGQVRLREPGNERHFFMHDTKQGVFLSTSVLKCFALGILSDKLPLGDTALPFFHPPTWNLTLLHVKCLISHCLK